MKNKVILLAVLSLLTSGCFSDKNKWEEVLLYDVGKDVLFDCSSGTYRINGVRQFDHNNDNIVKILLDKDIIEGIKDN